MNKKNRNTTITFLAGAIFGVLLTVQIPRMLQVQRERFHHPDYMPGALQKTGRPLDIAINGRGYFQFFAPNGDTIYSRLSEFTIDDDGVMVSKHGYPLDPMFKIPSDFEKLIVSPYGLVSVIQNNQEIKIGYIELASFVNPQDLEPTRKAYLKQSEKGGPPVTGTPGENGMGLLEQGYRLLPDIPKGTPKNLLVNGDFYNGVNDELQEPLLETSRQWDFAVDGPGFIAFTLPDGTIGYTRYLNLTIDEVNSVVKPYPKAQGIQVGVTLSPPLVKEDFRMEDIPLHRFVSPDNLHYYMRGLYVHTKGSGPPKAYKQGADGAGVLKRGFLNNVPRREP